MNPRNLPAAALMRAANDAPDRPGPRHLGVRQRFALQRINAAPGVWLEIYPHELQAVAALVRRGLVETDGAGRMRATAAPERAGETARETAGE